MCTNPFSQNPRKVFSIMFLSHEYVSPQTTGTYFQPNKLLDKNKIY